MNVTYTLTDKKVESPNTGQLFVSGTSQVTRSIPNGGYAEIDTGVTVNIPEGAAVQISPDMEWERTGVRVLPQLLLGPQRTPIRLHVWNHGGGTIRLSNHEHIANVMAHEAPKLVMFTTTKTKERKLVASDAA